MDEKIIDDWTKTVGDFCLKHNITVGDLLYFFNESTVLSMVSLGFNEKECVNYLKMMELHFLAYLKEKTDDNT